MKVFRSGRYRNAIEEYARTKAERVLGYSALAALKELFTDDENAPV